MTRHYLRRDLPDGHVDALERLAAQLIDGANELRSGSQSRDTEDRYNAAIDAHRLMTRIAQRLHMLAKPERIPG